MVSRSTSVLSLESGSLVALTCSSWFVAISTVIHSDGSHVEVKRAFGAPLTSLVFIPSGGDDKAC